MQIKGFKNEGQVAELLNFKPSSLSAAKQRNSYPFYELFTFCERENISLDDFFREGKAPELVITAEERTLIETYRNMGGNQRKGLRLLMGVDNEQGHK